MDNFNILFNDKELNDIITTVNDKNKDIFMGCHGAYHVGFVIKKTEYILSSLSYDDKTIELGKIAALLHDIGCIISRKDHAKISGKMCERFLCKTNLSAKDKNIVIQAVK